MGRYPLLVRALFLAAFFGVQGVSLRAGADDAQALFDRGLKDMLAGRYSSGCNLISESQKLDPRPGTLFTLAECYAKAGKIASALNHYGDFLAMHAALPADEQRSQRERAEISVRERAKLLEIVPRLSVSLPASTPEGTVVMKDGIVLNRDNLNDVMLVDPGEHVFVTQAPGGAPTEHTVTVRRGERKRVELVVSPGTGVAQVTPAGPKPPPTTRPRPTPDPSSEIPPIEPDTEPDQGPHVEQGGAQRTTAFVFGGIGIAGLAVGATAGALVLSERPVILEQCDDQTHACQPDGLAASERANTFGMVSTIGFAVGLSALATSAILFITEPRAEVKSSRASLEPSFGQAGRGLTVGVRGHF